MPQYNDVMNHALIDVAIIGDCNTEWDSMEELDSLCPAEIIA